MKTTDVKNRTMISKDHKNKMIAVSREFDAPVEKVWQAFTESEILDKWWGPDPWRAETKTMNFSPGGYWLYAMVSPENQRQWGRFDYLKIHEFENIEVRDAFCDENGKVNNDFPVSKGELAFAKTKNGTRVDFKMMFSKESDVDKIIETGFEDGITICFNQLESLLKK